jgi:hypothetical protein
MATVKVAPAPRLVTPAALERGDVVVIEDFLPSSDGFVHVVREVRDVGDGFVRVWFAVLNGDGSPRAAALRGRRCLVWDRLYDVAFRRPVGHRRDCWCDRCSNLAADVETVEVVA